MNSRLTLPNFVIIGAMKCGTSTLRYALHNHPDIFMVYPNEPRFFFSDTAWSQGLEHYSKFFENTGKAKILGEGSGFYGWRAYNPKTAKRMAQAIPNAKLIYMVRHPIERIVSHWSWEIANGKPVGSLEKAIKNHSYYIEMSMFYEQICAYRDYFDDSQIKILFLEDLKSNSTAFYEDCYSFLGVDSSLHNHEVNSQVINETAGRLTDTSFLMRVRTLPGMQSLRNLFPKSLIAILKPLLKTTKKPEILWSECFKQEVEAQVFPDSVRFLDYAGKPRNFWCFESQNDSTY